MKLPTDNCQLSTIMDTIAAIATPIGSGSIGVIRVSGPKAEEIASLIFSGSSQLKSLSSHTAHHGTIIHPGTREPLDDVVLTLFGAPRSYTGEDVVEISCHGGMQTVRAVLAVVLTSGARLAEPGEFTKRAFLNGKMDLAQAEAVNDIIRARTDQARKVALRQLDGALSSRIGEINRRILGTIATIEAAIDFPEDVPEPDMGWLRSEVESARADVESLIESFGRGRVHREGLRVVIAGRVNVGKSSLLNALLRAARAIVTPIPGTTRDVIEENLEIRGIPVVAIDTAGLRATDDPVERIGVELTQQSMDTADMVLLVLDSSQGLAAEDMDLLDSLRDRSVIVIFNKTDLLPDNEAESAATQLSRQLSVLVVPTSASTGTGIELLENKIAELLGLMNTGAESVTVTNIRHESSLKSAAQSLGHVLSSVDAGEPIDLLSGDLNAARISLGLITGETASEDLLDRIFSEFCIGK